MDINDNLIKISRSIKGVHLRKDGWKSDIKVSIVFPFCFIESGTGQRNYYSNPIRSKPEADVLSLKLK